MNLHKYLIYRSLHSIFKNPMKYNVRDYLLHLFYTFRTPLMVIIERRKFQRNPNISSMKFLGVKKDGIN